MNSSTKVGLQCVEDCKKDGKDCKEGDKDCTEVETCVNECMKKNVTNVLGKQYSKETLASLAQVDPIKNFLQRGVIGENFKVWMLGVICYSVIFVLLIVMFFLTRAKSPINGYLVLFCIVSITHPFLISEVSAFSQARMPKFARPKPPLDF